MNDNTLRRTREMMPDESFIGYLLRLTELNHYDRISWIIELAGLNGQQRHKVETGLIYEKKDLTKLSHLSLTDKNILESKLYLPTEENNVHSFISQRMHKIGLQPLKPKFCPLCLKQYHYIRVSWDLALVTCCPYHNCLLVDRCVSCGKRISLYRKKVTECKCGFDLSSILPKFIDSEETVLDSHIERLLKIQKANLPSLESPLKDLVLNELFTILSFFCCDFEKGSINDLNTFKHEKYNIQVVHDKLKIAVNNFKSWPDNFFLMIENTEFKSTSRKTQFGLQRDFGRFYEHLKNLYSVLPDLKEAFNQYLTDHYSGGYLRQVKSAKYLSRAEAATYLKTSDKNIDRLLEAGKLTGIRKKVGSRHFILIDKSSIDGQKLPYRNTDKITIQQVASKLNVFIKTAETIANSDLIVKLHGPEIDGFPFVVFDKSSVMRLLKQLDEKISGPLKVFDEGQHISFDLVLNLFGRIGITLEGVLKAILGDHLKIIGKDEYKGYGLKAYIFDKKQVKRYYRRKKEKKKGKDITIKDFAKSNRINETAIYFIVNRGFIITRDSGYNSIGRVIPEDSILKFQKKYIFASEILRKHNVNSFALASYLNRIGIKAVSGPKVDGNSTNLYLRKDLEGIDFSHLKSKKKRKMDRAFQTVS